jgi:hypothetical protein
MIDESFEEQTCDAIWIPKTEILDKRLVTTMGSFLASCSEDQIHAGYEELFAPLRGINGKQSIIEDIKEKTGIMCDRFICEAVNCLYHCMIRGIVATEIPRLVLSPISGLDLSSEESDESYSCAKIVRGCLWEVFASLVVLILSEGESDAPASTFDAIRRTRYIESKLYATNYN